MARKANREWATRSETVALVAEHGMGKAAQILAHLFNTTVETLQREADAMQASILKSKQDALAKLQADVAARTKAVESKQSKSA